MRKKCLICESSLATETCTNCGFRHRVLPSKDGPAAEAYSEEIRIARERWQKRLADQKRIAELEQKLENQQILEERLQALEQQTSFASPTGGEKQPAGDILSFDLGGGVKLKMKLIPAGSFMMGSGNGYSDEKTIHKVTLKQPFYMGIYPVTQAQYEAVTGENPSGFSDEPDSPQRPVEQVSWEDAKKFCQKLSQKTGKAVRLPSESEWEYACRAGSMTKYCFGDDEGELELYGNYEDTPIYGDESTSPVGSFRPNAWGLYDMHGNVWEWCEDKWHDDYNGAPTDGSPWLASGVSDRVCRGGCWSFTAGLCRSACRGRFEPACCGTLGFRLALFPAVH